MHLLPDCQLRIVGKPMCHSILHPYLAALWDRHSKMYPLFCIVSLVTMSQLGIGNESAGDVAMWYSILHSYLVTLRA